jgi:hypothetical protein
MGKEIGEGIFSMRSNLMLFSYEIFTKNSYRIISYRKESYKSNGLS